jgi:hypothetical protein
MTVKFIDDNLVGQKGLSRYLDPSISWDREATNYSIAIYTDSKCFTSKIDKDKNNYAWIIEPPIINGDNHINIIKPEYSSLFKKVFSYNRWIGDRINNFIFVPHGGSWLKKEDIGIHQKDKLCSMIFSNKQWNAGHLQRLRVYEKIKHYNNIDFFGSGVDKYIEYKIYGLKNYMFSITMENEGPQHLFSQNTDYFSEKLIDCFLTGTIPIYYGNKSIANYFNINGIILFEDPDSIDEIFLSLNPDLYLQKQEFILENFKLAQDYIHPEHIINEHLQ